MAQTFEDITRDVVDRYLQNILFIDDNAYSNKKENAFDANEISSVFAQKGKLYTIYAPSSTKDLENCAPLIAKSDVVVLDWYLNIEYEQQIADAEADVEVEEPRGIYTMGLIKNIVEDATEKKLKLIIVYTGDGAKLYDITKNIHEAIATDANYTIDEKSCQVSSANVTILVRAKDNGEKDQLKYNQDLQSKIVKYEDLPDFITAEFARFVGGLLPNFAMSTIASIRNNTSNIIGVFSKDIDPAFLGHYVSISDCDDAIIMLSEIFGSAITDLIDSSNFDIKTWIDTWLIQKFKKTFETTIGNNTIKISGTNLKNIVNSSESDFKTKLKKEYNNIKGNEDDLKKDATRLFKIRGKKPNYKLARLIQHSNLFLPAKAPRLTTGTIVKYKRVNCWKFLLCIQQSCDSVRIGIDGKEKKRIFLFLPLLIRGKGEAVVVEENKHLFVADKSYSIELHEFSPREKTDAQILAVSRNGQYVFTDTKKEQYIWVAELKKMFAQHVVSAYASKLSRVGVDNSEWIRLVGKKK